MFSALKTALRIGVPVVIGVAAVSALVAGFMAVWRIVPAFQHVGNPVSLMIGKSPPLKGEEEGRTNFLILGLAPRSTQTDTIIIASYFHKEKKIALVNVPRDLLTYDGHETTKITSLFAYAKARRPKDKDYPATFVADFLSKEYGIPIHYWITVNTHAAEQIVDSLGGVTVNVEDSFTDYRFPNDDYSGYLDPPPSFQSGAQLLDGKMAVIFARSRHSLMGNEGTDFARSHRQQLLIRAVLEKAKSIGILQQLSALHDYPDILGENVYTNMTVSEMISAARLSYGLDLGNAFRFASWSTTRPFLCSPPATATGAYVIMYGTIDHCDDIAGQSKNSPYRKQAAEFIQNLLQESSATGSVIVRRSSASARLKPAQSSSSAATQSGSGSVQ